MSMSIGFCCLSSACSVHSSVEQWAPHRLRETELADKNAIPTAMSLNRKVGTKQLLLSELKI
jgi:hypothetical protein